MSAGDDARPPPLARIPPQIACAADYEPFARERVDPAAWAYLDGAAGDGTSARDNREAFARIRLRNRVLAELSGGDTRVELFGDTLDFPILLAPVARQKLAHPDGELASALGASAMRAAMVVSTEASTTLEDVARAAQAPLWFQLYFRHDRAFTLDLVRRSEAAGYRALVLTVDAPVIGMRNLALPLGAEAANLRGHAPPPPFEVRPGQSLFDSLLLTQAPTWRDVEWLRAQTALPLLLKGITHPHDARRALDAGAAGIVVSNHGGRVLDTQVATIDALPAIADAVQGRVPLLLDGGIRRGSDAFKAIALGASAVLVGRPYLHALAAAGAPGVAHVLHLLRIELETTMALCGCRTLADIDGSALFPRGAWNPSSRTPRTASTDHPARPIA